MDISTSFQLRLDGIWLWWTFTVERYTLFAQASCIGMGTNLHPWAPRGDNLFHAKKTCVCLNRLSHRDVGECRPTVA